MWYFISLPKTLNVCFKAEYVRTLLFMGKIVKLCAKIVRNWKMLLVSLFVDALTQRFAPLYFIALQNILPLLSSSRYKLCYLGGK